MPTEINRKIATKTFSTPAGNIKVPVITEITFRDTVDRGQETTYKIDNSAKAHRDVHVAWVASNPTDPQATENADPNTPPPAGLIAVERIDQWRKKDTVERSQETFTKPDNKTYNPSGPPFFRTHLKTHVVSYRKDPTNPNDTSLLSSELIDEFVVKDPVDRGQETHFYLKNPKDDDAANAQITPDLPDITDTGNGVDPPYRTDPYQNIVRIGSQPMTVFWAYQAQVLPGFTAPAGSGYHFQLVAGQIQPSVTLPDGRVMVVTGGPTIPDIIFNQGLGINYLTYPWWLVGPDTDSTSGGSPGYHFYDATGPTASLSHSWPFFGYTYQSGNAPAIFVSAGTLSASFGPIGMTIDGVAWIQESIHITFFAVDQAQFGPAIGSMGWLPFFMATFLPP